MPHLWGTSVLPMKRSPRRRLQPDPREPCAASIRGSSSPRWPQARQCVAMVGPPAIISAIVTGLCSVSMGPRLANCRNGAVMMEIAYER